MIRLEITKDNCNNKTLSVAIYDDDNCIGGTYCNIEDVPEIINEYILQEKKEK